MKAVMQENYGDTGVLELRVLHTPETTDDEVLFELHAADLDPGVWRPMTGWSSGSFSTRHG
jgi:NADPH:quinone reductase-like Zn-dependent oxidoreductase